MPVDQFAHFFEYVVRQAGKPFFAPDGKSLGFTDSPNLVKDPIDMFLRLKAAGALYDPEDAFVTTGVMEEYPISRGKTWNCYAWSNGYIGLVAAAKRPLDLLIFPSVSGNKEPYGTYLKPAMFISILSTSKSQDLAARFVNFFVNDLEANRILLAERGIPIPTHVREDLAPRVTPGLKYLFDYITKVMPFTSPRDPPDPAAAGEVRDVMKPILLQCLTGSLTSEAAVARMVREANAVLSR